MLKIYFLSKEVLPYTIYSFCLCLIGLLTGYLQHISLGGPYYFSFVCFFWAFLGIVPPVRKKLNIKDITALATIGILGLPTLFGTILLVVPIVGPYLDKYFN